VSIERKVYSVTEIVSLVRELLETGIGDVCVEGEISNLRLPSSGHMYFTLKDASSQLRVAMFRFRRKELSFQPADGLLVRVWGRVTMYEKQGECQLVAEGMEQGGKGALQAQFEALKKKLQAEGLFDGARKKPLPVLPATVGIVTSPTGAAIRDMLKILSSERLRIVIVPVRVQGDGAAAEIAGAVRMLNEWREADVIIVGRGGGSIEDLWPFNEEAVARAIAGSAIPVISAVGHEVDVTISDLVADVRAATPSVAAEMIVGAREARRMETAEMGARMARLVEQDVLRLRNRLISAAASPVFSRPAHLVQTYSQTIDHLQGNMRRCVLKVSGEMRARLENGAVMISRAARLSRQRAAERAGRAAIRLRMLNPMAVLQRGYSLTTDEKGRVITSSDGLLPGRRVKTLLAKGSFESEVKEVHGDEKERVPGG